MFTVLGSSGFVGSHLRDYLEAVGVEYQCPKRGEPDIFTKDLGHVIYCIGLTADFREKPFETVEAHVCYLSQILARAQFDSFLYLSSTRIYQGAAAGQEDASLSLNPARPEDLYNASKLLGEAVCLSCNRPNIRIARLSNVVGKDFSSNNFLPSLIWDAIRKNKIVLRTTMASEKDYVRVEDVVGGLLQIAVNGRQQIYNLASGMNTTHASLIEIIQQETGCSVDEIDNSPTVSFPPISIARMKEDFGFAPVNVLSVLAAIIGEYSRQGALGNL